MVSWLIGVPKEPIGPWVRIRALVLKFCDCTDKVIIFPKDHDYEIRQLRVFQELVKKGAITCLAEARSLFHH